MPIAINGSGTVTGISVGGLPDGCVDTDTLATSVTRGKILQVVSTTKTDTFSEVIGSSGGYSAAAISLNFTATSTSNKLLIMANLMVGAANGSERVGIILFAGGSKLAVGDASSGKRRISMGGFNDQDNSYTCISHSHSFTPASTSQITYDYRLHNGRGASGTLYLNRCYNESQDNTIFGRGVSTITIMEVAP
jgi:hypothetical protein